MPAKFEDDLIWVVAGAPLTDSTFLSSKIKDLCGDLPIFWLRPTYSTSKHTFRHLSIQSHVKQNPNRFSQTSKEQNIFYFKFQLTHGKVIRSERCGVACPPHPPGLVGLGKRLMLEEEKNEDLSRVLICKFVTETISHKLCSNASPRCLANMSSSHQPLRLQAVSSLIVHTFYNYL